MNPDDQRGSLMKVAQWWACAVVIGLMAWGLTWLQLRTEGKGGPHQKTTAELRSDAETERPIKNAERVLHQAEENDYKRWLAGLTASMSDPKYTAKQQREFLKRYQQDQRKTPKPDLGRSPGDLERYLDNSN